MGEYGAGMQHVLRTLNGVIRSHLRFEGNTARAAEHCSENVSCMCCWEKTRSTRRGNPTHYHSGSKPSRIREEFLHASPLAIARRLRDSMPSDCLQLWSGRYLPLGLPGELGRTCIRPTPSRNSVSAPVKSSLAIVANSAHMRQIEFRLTGLRYRFISVLDLSLTSKMSIGRPACCKAAEMSMH
jgi:hypothetical protein